MSTTAVNLSSSAAALASSKAVVLPFPAVGRPASVVTVDDYGGEGSLEAAVGALNRYVATTRTDLSFRVDRETDAIVVSIVDSATGTVLRQMPSEEALRIARYLEHEKLGLVRQSA